MTDRATFIGRVRDRIADRGKTSVDIPSDWMPTIEDPVARFELEVTAVGGTFHAATPASAGSVLAGILADLDGPSVVVTREEAVPATVPDAITATGAELLWWPEAGRERTATITVGVTAAEWAVAETGTVLISSAPPGGRAPSLLTQVHVAFVSVDRLLPTVADLFRRIAEMPTRPSNLVLVTGPSKTADIENVLVRGVHGPGDLHVVLVGPD
jgi:L-lactate utilization protein LutC